MPTRREIVLETAIVQGVGRMLTFDQQLATESVIGSIASLAPGAV